MVLDRTRVTPSAPRYLWGAEEEEEDAGRVSEGTGTPQSQCGPPLNWKNT